MLLATNVLLVFFRLIENREVQVQVLLNQNKLKSFVSEEVRIKTEKSVELQAEFAAKAAEAKAMCLKSLEYQEMEKNRVLTSLRS